jgi:hypothetical protein
MVRGLSAGAKGAKAGGRKAESATDQLVRVLAPKKPPTSFSFNIRNSHINKSSMDYLCKALTHQDFNLTALNLKYCFLSFEFFIQLADAIRFNKTLVKLDLSNNCLKSCTARYLLDALMINQSITDMNFHGNLLDDEFAFQLAELLEQSAVLNKVDLSQNPIGAKGA